MSPATHDPWSSHSADAPDRAEARAGFGERLSLIPRRSYEKLFSVVIILVMLADQLSKSWFVYRLGSHQFSSFGAFLPDYWRLFAGFDGVKGIVEDTYWPFAGPVTVFGDTVRWLLTTNTGAAWSMFSGNSLALSGVSIAIATLLYYIWRRNFRGVASMSLACGAIIGGALGNFIDRFRLHEVVDFISVRIPYIGRLFPKLGDPYDFPIFNVADASAVCGTIALTIYLILHDRAHHAHVEPEPSHPQADAEAETCAAGMLDGEPIPASSEPPSPGQAG